MTTLNPEEVDSLLSQPITGSLVTLRPSGAPHQAPVWFLWDDGTLFVIAGTDSVKARNIRRNPTVSLCVATAARPYSYVTVEGQAVADSRELESVTRRICAHYDGPVRGAEYARELLEDDDMTLITITPERFITYRSDRDG